MSDEKKVPDMRPVENRYKAPDHGGDSIPDGSSYIERVVEAVTKSLAAIEAYKYVDCRRKGGSMEECLGIFKAATIPLPKPDIPAKEAIIVLRSVREVLLEHAAMLEREMKKIKP